MFRRQISTQTDNYINRENCCNLENAYSLKNWFEGLKP